MKHCACGLLVDAGQVLLGRRAADRQLYPSAWDLFGGHQETGEDLEQTLCRELQEEVDITPTNFLKLAVLSEPRPEVYGAYAYHVYLVKAWRGPGPTMLGREHSEIGWFALDQAVGLDLAHPGYRALLRKVLSP